MRVLIVKLSSMGDLVQTLPALTDAQLFIPDIEFEWVVDESFSEIPSWHPQVVATLGTAHRRWRKNGLMLWRNNEFSIFVKKLRSSRYDLVIDAQSNLKSALVTALSRGEKHGMDSASVREWGAHLAYGQSHSIAKNQLAISRIRQLFARALGYVVPKRLPDFGLANVKWQAPDIELPKLPYMVFVQNASWPNKRWDDDFWRQLIELVTNQGYEVLLPWGSQSEREQASFIAAGFDRAAVLPGLSLSELAAVLVRSAGTISVDTGLAHISAALNVPTVSLYGPTDQSLIGATGSKSAHVVASDYSCAPCYRKRCAVGDYQGDDAQCMKTIKVDQVWAASKMLMSTSPTDRAN
jgi:heptosyltransferase-1